MTSTSGSNGDGNQEILRLTPDVGESVEDGVVRSFSDPAAKAVTAATPRQAIERYLSERGGDMKSAEADLREVDASEGAATLRIRYQQYINDLPLLGAIVHAVADKNASGVVNVANRVDVDVAGAPDPDEALGLDQVHDAALAPFAGGFEGVDVVDESLAYVRYTERPAAPDVSYRNLPDGLLEAGIQPDGAIHLVRDLRIETSGPELVFRVVVDALDGYLLWVEMLTRQVAASVQVFSPDPVSESNDATLRGSSSAATLDPFRHAQTTEVDAAVGGTFTLTGEWFRCRDVDAPTFAQPSATTANFEYSTYPADRRFLSANAYFWLDSLARWLRSFGNTTLNANMVRVDVDAQAWNGADQSDWNPVTPPQIRFGEGGAPDAADLGVIVHEYMHGVFDWLGANHGGSVSYEHSYCDAMAAIYRDRFNVNGHRRTETFPFDNNINDQWSTERTLDRAERFDAANFNTFGFNLRNSMLGTAVWDCYMGMGGDSTDPGVRAAAADAITRAILEMLLIVPDDSSQDAAHAVSMAQGMITADATLTGGLYGKVMDAAFVRRGLWAPRTIDVYITDSPADQGDLPSPIPHWVSPDIWVRNVDIDDGDDPDQGHQPPINGVPNYMYVRVRNRGTQPAPAGTFQVEAYRCDPGTGMIWPNDFQSLGTIMITDPIPAGGSVRVGPFVWTPQIVDHECLLAVASGASDPAVTATLTSPVRHDQLVRFDNNVGQRNVAPQMATPGGKVQFKLKLRGGLHKSVNSWALDASAFPEDTKVTIRLPKRLVDGAASSTFDEADGGTEQKAALAMSGGLTAELVDFDMDAKDVASVEVTIDFSHQADHLARYPLVATQYQDGTIAGRVTMEVTAVKELEDFFFGNPRSLEAHISTCPFFDQLGPRSRVPYANLGDLIARGYNGCAFCLPQADTDLQHEHAPA